MKIAKRDGLIWALLLIPFVIIFIFWSRFPEEIPVHFNFEGKPDNYSDKVTGLFLLPVISIIVYISFLIFPGIDPVKKNYLLFQSTYLKVRLLIHAFLTLIFILIAMYSLGYPVNMSVILYYCVPVLFLLLGNYMTTVRQNYFFGIRTPWTLASEEVWLKTHRFAGPLWVVTSLLMLVLNFFITGKDIIVFFLCYVAILAILPIGYSYLLFRKAEKNTII
ncbi:SdpI family protein [soil metagenome]